MTGRGEPAMLPLAQSPWRPLYREAASWIPLNHDVVDLGCGTGRFLKQLLQNDHYGNLVGVDLSPAALKEAERYVPKARFEAVDLDVWYPDPDRAGATTYTCLETLEHLEGDLDLVRRVPPGHQFVFSVPNYESETHVRWFRTAGELWARYDGLLSFRKWSLIMLDDRKVIHVVDSLRRVDSW